MEIINVGNSIRTRSLFAEPSRWGRTRMRLTIRRTKATLVTQWADCPNAIPSHSAKRPATIGDDMRYKWKGITDHLRCGYEF
jgi:hypothetical protein